jgi:5-methylcytosine-specific restriction endonuclease McrA
MSVFVLDKRKQPLMPCSEKRARLLLSRHRAVVHRMVPFTIRLKDRTVQESVIQHTVLKVDPGSKTTGMALARVEDTSVGQVHHALHLAELIHRGEVVRERMSKRANYRRRRRTANLRYRAPRWRNRRRAPDWLPPSLQSRISNVLTWAKRYQCCVPLSRIEVEQVKFDLTLLQNPEATGVDYQRGELFGWEVRSYLLEKFGRSCAYCGCTNVPFEIDHQVPLSRGGSDRVSNLVLSCHRCNLAKGNRTAAEWGHPRVENQAGASFRDAAAVNTTRKALVENLMALGVQVGTWSGGRTRWNRDRFGLQKAHCLDALCVGELAGIHMSARRTLVITAYGRGRYQRTNVDAAGFPRGHFAREKRIRGCSTGDLVRAEVPGHLKTAGVHLGRVAVRTTVHFG